MDKIIEKQAKRLIKRAANWLEKHDWCQNNYYLGNPTNPKKCCVSGIINFLDTGDARNFWGKTIIGVEALEIIRNRVVGSEQNMRRVAAWNDKPEQTKENVIKTLREIADAK